MGSRPIASATDRFKALLANALERVCVLEEQLELAQQRLAELDTDTEQAKEQTRAMTQAENPHKPITGDQGFAAFTWAISRWVPQRLTNAANSRKGLRALRKGKR